MQIEWFLRFGRVLEASGVAEHRRVASREGATFQPLEKR